MAELEELCPRCRGRAGETEMGQWCPCCECGGAGYIPTEEGRKILALIRHHFRRMLEDVQRDE